MNKYFKQGLSRLVNNQNFKEDFLRNLPTEYQSAAKLLYYYKLEMTSEEKALSKHIESFRKQIPGFYDKTELKTFSSPHSNTFKLKNNSTHAEPGNYESTKMENIMKTGSDIFKGLILRRIIEGTGRKKILELGTNTGFSGSYFTSVNGVELVTIEGSKDLCNIAESNISRVSDNFRIMNCLFDDAIDQLLEEEQQFDCVFIDGQHERDATIHYTKRLEPLMSNNSIYIYDDIYWSDGMNQVWKELFMNFGFSHGIDLQLIGVFRKTIGSKRTNLFDINDYLPRPRIYNKGW